MSSGIALILDFGGVVTRTLFETHELTERALGLSPGSLTWQGPFAPESDELWMAMQNDRISEREYWAQRTSEVGRLLGEHWTEMSQFVMAARGADPESVVRPQAVQAIDTAKTGGAKLAILSNELDLFYGPEFRSHLPLLQKFDVIADATYTKMLKPDARAYLACAKELDVDPHNCVFVDDQARNVQGAKAVGMNAVHFDVRQPGRSFQQALSLLLELPEELEHA
jgi:putative hydrolase of the HAD superfamily